MAQSRFDEAPQSDDDHLGRQRHVQIGTLTYSGKDQIRSFWATAAPFQSKNVWVDETPAYKAVITVNGATGTLYFECHFVDVPDP